MSNVNAYLAIANDALATSRRATESHRRPKPDGSPGWIITPDPTRSSFRNSLIAVVFAGVYLDALLYIVGTQRLGRDEYRKIERREYETKLRKLQITDSSTLEACKRFREARNDIVHEKAGEVEPSTVSKLRFAQDEAEHAVAFVVRVGGLLRPAK